MNGIIGNSSGVSAATFEFAAVTTVDINSQKVFRDVAFSWSKRFTIGASATVNIVIDPTALGADIVPVVLPVNFTAVEAGPINIDLYFGTDSDEDGTLIVGGNRDNRSSTVPVVTVRLAPTINDDGTKTPFEAMIPSDGVAAVSSFGGQSKDDLIFIARKDGKYMFRLINTENAVAQASIAMTIFEAIKGV